MTGTVAPEKSMMDIKYEHYQLAHCFHMDFNELFKMIMMIMGQGSNDCILDNVPEICGEFTCLAEICTKTIFYVVQKVHA